MKTIVDVVDAFRPKNKTALIFKDGFRDHRWSYQKLHDSVARFCSLLEQKGVKRGDHVLIWGPNSPE